MAHYMGPWRDGDLMVIHERTPMPQVCPVCNSPSSGEPLRVAFRSGRKSGVIAGAINAAYDKAKGWKYTGPVSVTVHFCEAHRKKRLYHYIVLGLMAIVGGIVIALFGEPLQQGKPPSVPMFIGVLLVGLSIFLSLMILSGSLAIWFKAKRFWNRTVWITGVSREFLDTLPQRSDADDD